MANNELSMAGHWDSCQWSDEDRTFMINTLDEVIGGLEYIRSKIRNKETVVSEDWQKAAIPFRKAMDSFIAYTMKSTDPSMPFIPQTKGNELEKSQSQNNMMIFEYGAMSSRYSVEAPNKLIAYAAMIAHFGNNAHLIVLYEPKEVVLYDRWLNPFGAISERLDEIFGGAGAFDEYVKDHEQEILDACDTIKQLS